MWTSQVAAKQVNSSYVILYIITAKIAISYMLYVVEIQNDGSPAEYMFISTQVCK